MKRPAAAKAAQQQQVRGRPFQKGQSGNPSGPKPGSRHKLTVLAEQLMADDLEAVIKKVVSKAKRGDMTAAKLLLDRVAPARRGRVVHFRIPPVQSASDAVHALGSITAAVGRGELSVEEASDLSRVVDINLRAIETVELEQRLAKIEARMERNDE